MSRTLTFFHTSPVHIATFDALLAELAPSVTAQHVVDESLLREVRDAGHISPEMRAKVRARMTALSREGMVLCTCSTIGGCAEEAGSQVIRVDRPMATQAVQMGARIIVAATSRSTLKPTCELVLDEAKRAGKKIEVIEVFCEGAWAWFEKGEQAQYVQVIAHVLEQEAERGDVILLAQASMAGATALCAHLGVPILSSPRIGLEAALAAQHVASAQRASSPLSAS